MQGKDDIARQAVGRQGFADPLTRVQVIAADGAVGVAKYHFPAVRVELTRVERDLLDPRQLFGLGPVEFPQLDQAVVMPDDHEAAVAAEDGPSGCTGRPGESVQLLIAVHAANAAGAVLGRPRVDFQSIVKIHIRGGMVRASRVALRNS